MKLYKIRNKKTGLYSSGGYSLRWTKIGKVWRTLGPLKNHLQGGAATAYDRLGDDVEVVEIEMKEVGTLDFREIMRGVREARAERERRQQETHERVMRGHKEAQLAQLKRELGHD